MLEDFTKEQIAYATEMADEGLWMNKEWPTWAEAFRHHLGEFKTAQEGAAQHELLINEFNSERLEK